MPKAEQERRLRWFSEEEGEAWLRRQLEQFQVNQEGDL
jgi:hypothetical protein